MFPVVCWQDKGSLNIDLNLGHKTDLLFYNTCHIEYRKVHQVDSVSTFLLLSWDLGVSNKVFNFLLCCHGSHYHIMIIYFSFVCYVFVVFSYFMRIISIIQNPTVAETKEEWVATEIVSSLCNKCNLPRDPSCEICWGTGWALTETFAIDPSVEEITALHCKHWCNSFVGCKWRCNKSN